MEVSSNNSLFQVLHPLQDAEVGFHCLLLHLPGLLQFFYENILILYLKVKQWV